MLHVSPVKYRREHGQRFQLAGAVCDGHGNAAVFAEAVLPGRDHHSAAEKSAFHRRRKPDLFISPRHAVDRYFGVDRTVCAEKPLQRDKRVIHPFLSRFALTVRLLGTVTVDSVADAVEKAPLHPVYRDFGKSHKIPLHRKRHAGILHSEVVEKIVPRSAGVIHNILRKVDTGGIVYKAVERSVTAGNDKSFVRQKRCKKRIIALNSGNIAEIKLTVRKHIAKLSVFRQSFSASGVGIVKYAVFFHDVLLRCFMLFDTIRH